MDGNDKNKETDKSQLEYPWYRRSFNIYGISFAPLVIPFHRRLELFSALHWATTFYFAGFGFLGLSIYLLFTKYYPVSVIYYIWYFYDRNTPSQGGRPVERFKEWSVWKWMRDYFPIGLIKTDELHPSKNYILGYHPHGIICCGICVNFLTNANKTKEMFPGITFRVLTLAGLFQFPIFREYLMCGGASSCKKDSMRWILTREGIGNCCVLIVGGAREVLNASPKNLTLILKNQKGFCKIALETGTSLVPSYSFGENDCYNQLPNPKNSYVRIFQEKMMKFTGFATPFFYGRGVFNYSFGILPHRRQITTVVGSPIDVVKINNPSSSDIDKLHSKYMESLNKLFNEHKQTFGYQNDDYLNFE